MEVQAQAQDTQVETEDPVVEEAAVVIHHLVVLVMPGKVMQEVDLEQTQVVQGIQVAEVAVLLLEGNHLQGHKIMAVQVVMELLLIF